MVYYKGPVQDGNGVKEIKGFYPVDSEGIVLPGEDFLPDPDEDASESEYNKYFQIFAGKNGVPPASSIGMPFGDPRITEAISLCIYLEKLRDQLGIKELEIAQEQFSLGPSPYLHVLLTGDSPPRKIIWGHAPEKEVSGEPKPEDKKQRLGADALEPKRLKHKKFVR